MYKLQIAVVIVVLLLLACIGGLYLTSRSTPIPLSAPLGSAFPLLHNPTPEPVDETVTLVFAGDIMLDRNIRLKAQQNGYDSLIGPRLKELLTSAHYAVVNLEGPVTSNPSVSVGSAVGSSRNFLFTFAPESVAFLKAHNMTIVNLGNNHILNFGTEGLSETYQLLDQGGVKYFGFTGSTQPEGSSIFVLEHNSNTVGFVNYNQFISEGEEQAFADIEKIRPSVEYLVLYTHWGNEYVQENQVLIELAHRFVDAGVDLLIGSHPHVVTGHEVYRDKHIYYSLGNFIFDQYFEPEVKKGLVVKAEINPETKETFVTEAQVNIDPSGQTELAPALE